MTTAVLKKQKTPAESERIGPECNGMIMSPHDFDNADFDDFWRFELVNGVLVVSPIPSPSEAGRNEGLGHLLLSYQEHHPQGSCLDASLPESTQDRPKSSSP